MDIKERQQLRITLLKELYDLHFDSGKPNKLIVPMGSLKNEDYEKYQAYNYLLSKSLIEVVKSVSTSEKAHFKITIYGIDEIESIELKKEA